MKARLRFFFWWLLAVLLAFGFEVFLADFNWQRWKNVVENLLFALGMLLTILLFNSKRIKVFLANFYFLLFVVCLFFESVFFYLFGTNFSASAIFIFIETNAAEATEFLNFYLDFSILVFLVVLMLMSFFYLRETKKPLFKKRSPRIKFTAFSLLISLLVFMKFSGMIDPNLPYLVGKSVWDYSVVKEKMSEIDLNDSLGNFKEVKLTDSLGKKVYVLIIGESTTRNHLGLYGYDRETTPKLTEIKNELLVYKNVISSHAFTIGALRDALTITDFEGGKSSVVQLMNQAGFKTYWFSNQRPLGPYESLVTNIAQASDVVQFTNSGIAGGITPYDNVLLDFLEKALAEVVVEKKFVVLHILGTHLQYKNRYPESFDYFNDRPKSNFEDELAYSRINAYDNAVRYMDQFIRKVIEQARRENASSYVLYFSDHGEEIYEDRYSAGHLDANPTKNMFEIPFVLWRSEKCKKEGSIYTGNLKKPYVLDDFMYSFAELSRVEFRKMKQEKSIFSKKFQPKKRIVGEGIDFDVYFEKE